MSYAAGLAKPSGLSELKKRVLFLILGICIFRLGIFIPVPGVDTLKMADFINQQSNTILGLFNMFSGGALMHVSIFALGIMPYISASIIIQLMTAVVPSLAELKKEGESGNRKITQYTRVLTLCIALLQSVWMSKFAVTQGLVIYHPLITFYVISMLTLSGGTMFLMWLGEQMTERGVGNGISLLITAGILSHIPSAIGHTFEQTRQGNMSPGLLILIFAVMIAVTLVVVFVERALRRITINYAQRQQGNKMMAAQKSHLPLKINMAGVIPPIFASSILMIPATLAKFVPTGGEATWLSTFSLAISPGQPLYLMVFSAAIIFFCFFYTAIIFNPQDTADNLKKSGAFIPGIRPGIQTSKYIDKVMSRLTLVGSIYITLVCLIPMLMMGAWNVPFYFGGTSLLIVVVVMMDLMTQLQSHMMSTRYESILKKANIKGKR